MTTITLALVFVYMVHWFTKSLVHHPLGRGGGERLRRVRLFPHALPVILFVAGVLAPAPRTVVPQLALFMRVAHRRFTRCSLMASVITMIKVATTSAVIAKA